MSVVLTVLLWLLAVVALLLLAILLLPFSVTASGSHWQGELDARVRVGWAFGLLSVGWQRGEGASLALFGLRLFHLRPSSDDAPKQRSETKAKRSRSVARLRHHLGAYRRILASFVRALALRLRVRGAVGLANPADTALLAQGARMLVPTGEWLDDELEVDYLDEKFAIEGQLRARLCLAWLGMLVLGMLLRRDTRRALLALRASLGAG